MTTPLVNDIEPVASLKRSDLAERVLYLDGRPFSLKDYPFFRGVYDCNSPDLLLKTSRQVSKCLYSLSFLSLPRGKKRIADIKVGDKVLSLDAELKNFIPANVSWVSEPLERDTVEFKTQRGFVVTAGLEHPFLCWNQIHNSTAWYPAHNIHAGMDVAIRTRTGILSWDTVVERRPRRVQTCYDITVDSPSHAFVADGFVTHNSTTCGNLMIIDSISVPHFKTLYIAPTKEQTSTFSNTRLLKVLQYSPEVRNVYIDPGSTNNVLLTILRNGSEMILSYALDDPDRVRGKTADREFIDEVQDIAYDAVIPVVKECMANSNYGWTIYAGTPKSMENTIEYLWQKSSQSEWVMKCTGCGQHQVVVSKKSVGLKGAICVKCGKLLPVRNGFWYDFNKNARMKGFHISQPIMPLNNEVPARWQRILDKMETYSESKFNNEVLGISDAIGARMLSLEELEAMCADYYVELPIPGPLMADVRAVVGGVDWSGQGSEFTSRTVAWVFGLTNDYRLKTLYYRIFKGENPVQDVAEVADVFAQCGCQAIVGDAGGNPLANTMLRDRLGQHRMFQAQYSGNATGKLLRWNRKDRYIIDRSGAIDSFMLRLKRKEVIFPMLNQMTTPIQDILNEYEEVTQPDSARGGRRVWRHAASAPDDCLHAMVFAWLASKILQGELEMYERE